jgi:hypothetical protein
MRLSRWCSVVRLLGYVLILLAACPFTAPFKPVDLSTPADSRPAGAEALLQAKGTVEDPLAALAIVAVLFSPWGVTSARPGRDVSTWVSAKPRHVPLRI